jgi:penicillin-insensitive murein endopeptidase
MRGSVQVFLGRAALVISLVLPIAPAALAQPPAAATSAAPVPGGDTGSRKSAPASGSAAAKADPLGAKPAREVFGAAKAAAALPPRAIGFYSKGCLAGAQPIALDGPAWQVMRLSRNRHWGHPRLVRLVERLAVDAQKKDGWPGLLVGDISQPRGGPMLTGHASHQVGLDADIWLTPMPGHRLSRAERENKSAVSMLAAGGLAVDPKVWTPAHVKLIARAASYAEVERVLVHPAIKKALCEAAPKGASERAWLGKVRPYWGHHYHMHIRMACPKDSVGCVSQKPPSGDDGCGKEVDDWLKVLARPPKPPGPPSAKPARKRPPLTVAQLPPDCRQVATTATDRQQASGEGAAGTGKGRTAADR